MRVHHHQTDQFLPHPRDEVFRFFSDAANLEAITPPWLQFRILTPGPIQMSEGTLIDYRLRVHGIPLRWQTRIEVWDPPWRFVDVQVRGPYRLWHHEHTFEEVAEGTLVRDHVRYAPFGGALVHRLFVRKDIERIFAHRRQRFLERFAPPQPAVGAGQACPV